MSSITFAHELLRCRNPLGLRLLDLVTPNVRLLEVERSSGRVLRLHRQGVVPAPSLGHGRGVDRVTVDLDPNDYDILRDFAHSERMTQTDVIRALVRLLDDPSSKSASQQVSRLVMQAPTLDGWVEAACPPALEEELEHGEVFTRRWVVDLILDLAGYTEERDLGHLRLMEPACGSGAFLGPAVERLSRSCRAHELDVGQLEAPIVAFDLLSHNVEASRKLVEKTLADDGWPSATAQRCAATWIQQADFLLRSWEPETVDFVVGNPPYIRLEAIPDERMRAYRASCTTMTGRSDVYVGFYELGLRSLRTNGVLAFICADRWMRNQYGRHLRRLITEDYSVESTVTMHDVDAFEEPVSAYPAITVLRRGQQRGSVVANTTGRFGDRDATELLNWTKKRNPKPVKNDRYEVARLPHWFEGDDSWPSGSPARLALLEDLNERFHTLEDASTGTCVGIGVATGADGIFVTKDADLAEADRMLPLSMVRDTRSGHIDWSGHFLVNPWDESGNLVHLEQWPKLEAHFNRHRLELERRNISSRRPAQWYRTIDKVDAALTARPKLLFPDMKLTIHPVLDGGGLYPHHNLYYVVSDLWDLSVLGGLLLSRVAEFFVDAYAVKMRGGTLRFQAQYLRRIRVPHPSALSAPDREALTAAFEDRDVDAATAIAVRLYDIDPQLLAPS